MTCNIISEVSFVQKLSSREDDPLPKRKKTPRREINSSISHIDGSQLLNIRRRITEELKGECGVKDRGPNPIRRSAFHKD